MRHHTFRVDGNRLRSPGVSFGYGDSDPHLVAQGKQYMVARIASHQDWLELGRTAIYPARWFLLRVEWLEDGRFKVAEEVKVIEPGRRWQKAKKELIAEMERLEKDGIPNNQAAQ